jgi:hypothetical protein
MDPKYVLAHRISTVKSRPRDVPKLKAKPQFQLQFVNHVLNGLDTPITSIDDWALAFPRENP